MQGRRPRRSIHGILCGHHRPWSGLVRLQRARLLARLGGARARFRHGLLLLCARGVRYLSQSHLVRVSGHHSFRCLATLVRMCPCRACGDQYLILLVSWKAQKTVLGQAGRTSMCRKTRPQKQLRPESAAPTEKQPPSASRHSSCPFLVAFPCHRFAMRPEAIALPHIVALSTGAAGRPDIAQRWDDVCACWCAEA